MRAVVTMRAPASREPARGSGHDLVAPVQRCRIAACLQGGRVPLYSATRATVQPVCWGCAVVLLRPGENTPLSPPPACPAGAISVALEHAEAVSGLREGQEPTEGKEERARRTSPQGPVVDPCGQRSWRRPLSFAPILALRVSPCD